LKRVSWYFLPCLAIILGATYVSLAVVWHVNPPVVAVEGGSMRPFLQTGDLVLLHSVNPNTLKVGQVIAIALSKSEQLKYGIPGHIVHRIISIKHTASGLAFQTKGDANSGPDVFITYSSNVVGIMTGKVPYLGYPIVFFRSRQGEIFAGVAAFVMVTYFLLGWLDRRRTSDPVMALLENVVTDLADIRFTVESGIKEEGSPAGVDVSARHAPVQQNYQQLAEHSIVPSHTASTGPGAGPFDIVNRLADDLTTNTRSTSNVYDNHVESTNLPPFQDPTMVEDDERTPSLTKGSFKGLTSSMDASVEMASRTNQSVRELLEAMREYAQHLRSHTAAVQGMSQASMDLASITSEIRDFIEVIRDVAPRTGILPQQSKAPSVSPSAVMQNLTVPISGLYRASANLRPTSTESPRNSYKQMISAQRVSYVSSFMVSASDTVLDPLPFFPPELLAQRNSLMSTTARVDRLLHELSTRLDLQQ
jgi:signal peptidase I